MYRLPVTLSPTLTFLTFCVFHCFPEASIASLSSVVGILQRYVASWGDPLRALEFLAVWMEGGMLGS